MAAPVAGWRLVDVLVAVLVAALVAVLLVSVAIKDRQGVSTVVDAYTRHE